VLKILRGFVYLGQLITIYLSVRISLHTSHADAGSLLITDRLGESDLNECVQFSLKWLLFLSSVAGQQL